MVEAVKEHDGAVAVAVRTKCLGAATEVEKNALGYLCHCPPCR